MLKDNKNLCLILKIIVITSRFFYMTSIETVFLYVLYIYGIKFIYMYEICEKIAYYPENSTYWSYIRYRIISAAILFTLEDCFW